MPQRWIDFLFARPRLTFVFMGLLFILFGITSVNLFVLLKMNIDLFLQYGLMVIADGALEQLVDLIGSAYLSMVFYILFKVCERVLVERMTASRFARMTTVHQGVVAKDAAASAVLGQSSRGEA